MAEDRRPSGFFNESIGIPDPINYLRSPTSDRGTSVSVDERRRFDSDDEEAMESEQDGVQPKPTGTDTPRPQEPPARERPVDGSMWPYRETLSFTRSLLFYGAGSVTQESEHACRALQECRFLRQKYQGGKGTQVQDKDMLTSDNLIFRIGDEGVAEISHPSEPESLLIRVPTIDDFNKDYNRLAELVSEGAVRSFCFQRLQMLSTSFKMHTTINGSIEQQEQNGLLGNDFYRTLKIDNHIHAAAAPSAKQFVEFVRRKLETEGDVVVNKEGKTLNQIFEEAGLESDHLTIDAFDVLADYSVYQRFDNFNEYVDQDQKAFFLFNKST